SLHGPENGQPLVPRSNFCGCRYAVSSELKGKAAHTRCAASFLFGLQIFSLLSRCPNRTLPVTNQAIRQKLFPLDRAWWLGANIVDHPGDTGHFIDDAGRDAF